MKNLIKRIEEKQDRVKEMKANIRYLQKKISKKIDYLGCLKLDAMDLVKVIDALIQTKNELNILYFQQNNKNK